MCARRLPDGSHNGSLGSAVRSTRAGVLRDIWSGSSLVSLRRIVQSRARRLPGFLPGVAPASSLDSFVR
jgi:hypothetical protein